MSEKVELKGGRYEIPKDPNAVLDYVFDWTKWLASHTPVDEIASHSTSQVGVTVASSSRSGALVTVWISGGTLNQPASVTCRIVTTGGRTEDQTLHFVMRER